MHTTKLTSRLWMLLALLMVSTVCAKAETGTIERWGSKMKYSFSDGVITKKRSNYISGVLRDEITTYLWGEMKAGATITVSCSKVAGPDKYKKVSVSYFFEDSNGKMIGKENTKEEEGTATTSFKIPENAKTVHVVYDYFTLRTKFHCITEWKVTKGTVTQTQTNSNVRTISDTYSNKNTGVKVSYSIYGAEPIMSGGVHRAIMKAYPGSTVKVTAQTVSGENGKLRGTCYAKSVKSDGTEKEEYNKVEKDQSSVSMSYTIPHGVTEVDFTVMHNWVEVCNVVIRVTEKESSSSSSSTTTTKTTSDANKFNLNDVAIDNKCEHCKKPYSNWVFNTGGKGDWGAGSYSGCVGCKTIALEKYDVAIANRPIYENDGIYTKGGMEAQIYDSYNEDNYITLEENTRILYVGKVDGKDRFSLIKGTVWVDEGLKFKRLKKPEFSLTNMQIKALGTVYVMQDDGKTSRVYLLAGSIEAISNKTKKKLTLKPGQVVTAGKDGNMEVKKFDIAACAKKYGIPMSKVENHNTNSNNSSSSNSSSSKNSTTTNSKKSSGNASSTTSAKHYEMKTGIIKYKYTTGNQQGTFVRTFDEYGQYERQTLKMNGASKRSLTILRGNTLYQVDESAKTATKKVRSNKNFLNITEEQLKQLNLTKKGTATVADKTCVVYTGNNEEYYVWKGVVLKKVSKTKNGTTTYEAVSIEQPDSVKEANFKLTKEYKVK